MISNETMLLLKDMDIDVMEFNLLSDALSKRISQIPAIDKPLFNSVEDIVNLWNPENIDVDIVKYEYDGIINREYDIEICIIFSIIKQSGTKENLQAYIEHWLEGAIAIWERCEVKGRPVNVQIMMDEGKEYIERLYALKREKESIFDSLPLENAEELNVGIFWYFNDKVEIEHIEKISKSSNFFDIGNNEICINPQKDHMGMWYGYCDYDAVVNPEIISKYGDVDYNYYPRGRVTYYVNRKTKKQYYLVLTDKCFMRDKGIQNKIKSAFNLNGHVVRFETDSHYTCHNCREADGETK
jgi:hypothetical protein